MVSALAPVVAAGCDPAGGSEVEKADQALTQDPAIDVGFGIQRALHRVCSRKCIEWEDAPRGPGQHCVKFGDDCSTPVTVSLHADAPARSAGVTFPPSASGDWTYLGCGPTAAKNILSWYGVEKNITEVAARMVTKDLPGEGNIATAPDDLADGLRSMLNEWADGNFEVTVRSNVDVRYTVRASLSAGNPIIVLVEGGNHWQVVTRLEVGDYTLIDYPWANWETGSDTNTYRSGEQALNLDIDFPGWFVYGYHGYKSNTVVTIVRR